jgi:hypothetical protein
MLSRMIILSIGKKDSAKMRTAPTPEMQLIEEESLSSVSGASKELQVSPNLQFV